MANIVQILNFSFRFDNLNHNHKNIYMCECGEWTEFCIGQHFILFNFHSRLEKTAWSILLIFLYGNHNYASLKNWAINSGFLQPRLINSFWCSVFLACMCGQCLFSCIVSLCSREMHTRLNWIHFLIKSLTHYYYVTVSQTASNLASQLTAGASVFTVYMNIYISLHALRPFYLCVLYIVYIQMLCSMKWGYKFDPRTISVSCTS